MDFKWHLDVSDPLQDLDYCDILFTLKPPTAITVKSKIRTKSPV